MARLKRWESPRREGRNDKGKKSSARQRQLKKQTQMLRKRLKQDDTNHQQNNQKGGSGTQTTSPFFGSQFLEQINGMNPRGKPRLVFRPKGQGMNPKRFKTLSIQNNIL